MTEVADSTRAFWITHGVGRTLGIRFGEAIREGRFTAVGYARMVDRCAQCCQTDRCITWLAAPNSGSCGAPDYCPNAAELDRLAARRSPRCGADKPV